MTMATFNPGNIEDLNKSTTINQAEILGYISVDKKGDEHCDRTQQRYLRRPPKPDDVLYDLNAGYRDVEDEPKEKFENINTILFWIRKTDNNSLMYCCETDAFDEKNNAFVELKTYVQKTEPWAVNILKRFKLLQWWTQEHVGGVREILCGHMDTRGIVTRLESFATDDIPSLCGGLYHTLF
ncbi:hypothetical protein DPMN_169553 [Dreissena polymorpha]|uniref:Decapping nuclease n=1 Tax=Dreissena polymorpha TaxID=45954 RepID=A0A9D4DWS3_DREPO|nr:hypothetical protein DPMN_169553 [Dreissena polymorpha]